MSDNGISQYEAGQAAEAVAGAPAEGAEDRRDIKAGKVDPEKAAKDLQDDASDLTNDALDAAKDSDIPDDVKKQLEDAQKQLEAAGNGS